MPGPKVSNKLVEKLKPENESVFDPLHIQLLRKATGVFGDPTDVVGQLAPTPLVSIFKDKAAREASTTLFRNAGKILGSFSSPLAEAVEQFATKYPRIAAHIDLRGTPMPIPPKNKAYGRTPDAVTQSVVGKVKDRIPIAITEGGINAIARSPNNAKRYLAHEGTHVAQMLGNSDMAKLYAGSHKVYGYHNNPFEQRAVNAGAKAEGPSKDYLGRPFVPPVKVAQGKPAPKLLKEKLEVSKSNASRSFQEDLDTFFSLGPKAGKPRQNQKVIDALLQLLKDRESRGWTPSGK